MYKFQENISILASLACAFGTQVNIFHKIIWLAILNYDSPLIEGSGTWFAAKTWVERIIKRITPRNINDLEYMLLQFFVNYNAMWFRKNNVIFSYI